MGNLAGLLAVPVLQTNLNEHSKITQAPLLRARPYVNAVPMKARKAPSEALCALSFILCIATMYHAA
jgi:hypothetical protein